MEHCKERSCEAKSKVVVLFLHGICGTPKHFSPFVPCVPSHMTVCNLLLDGHGADVRAFSRTSMRKWEQQVEATVNTLLKEHEKLYIVAHSMGTLFAIEQAVRHPNVSKLFLLAVPIKLRLSVQMLKNAWNLYWGKGKSNDPRAEAAKACCGVHCERNPFLYLGWIPRYLELFSKIGRTKRLLPMLACQSTAYQSLQDETVSNRSVAYLEQNTNMRVVPLEHSAHFYYEASDMAFLLQEFRTFLT